MSINKIYLDYIKTSIVREPIYRIDLLNDDNTIVSTISDYVENGNGNITISNQDGSRRSCSITLRNYKGEFTEYFHKLRLGQRFKVWLGYKILGKDYLFPQGVFVFEDPSLQNQNSVQTISLSGKDKWGLLDGTVGGILSNTYQVGEGTVVGDFIKNTLSLDIVGDYVEPNISVDVYNMTTSYDIEHNAGETIADVITEIAANISCYVYYDENGVFTMKPFEYDETLASIYDYTTDDINYLSCTKNIPMSKLYNSVALVADNTQDDDPPIYASLDNNDLSDPNSVANGAIKKVYNITDDIAGISTEEQAMSRCRYELKKVVCMQSTISLQSMPMYHFIENNVITLTDKRVCSDDERFLISGITFNIGTNGDMTLDLVKTSSFM